MAWWLSEALSWMSNPRKVYDPLRVAKPTLFAEYYIDLFTAVNEQEYMAQGNVLQITDWNMEGNAGAISRPYIRINEPSYPKITVVDGTTIFAPIYRFYLTVPSGLRGSFKILVGRAAMCTNGIGVSLHGENFLSTAYFKRMKSKTITISAGTSEEIIKSGVGEYGVNDIYIKKVLITNPNPNDMWISHAAGGDQYPLPAYREMTLDFSACSWRSNLASQNRIIVGNPNSSDMDVHSLVFYSYREDFL